jgi:hypothetical protein
MLQRGRKSRGSKEFLALIGRASPLQSDASAPELPEPPNHFDDAERETWYAILRENPHLNYCGCMLLGMAINAAARAQYCAEIVDKAAGPLSIDNRGRLNGIHSLALKLQIANSPRTYLRRCGLI